MSLETIDPNILHAGRERLHQPLLPLVRLVQLLLLTGPFQRLAEVLAQLHEPLDTAGFHYPDPGRRLAPYLAIMHPLEAIKNPAVKTPAATVLNEQGEPLPGGEARLLLVSQAVLERELEEINSLLCGPCRCSLCCIGPTADQEQLFFEIPLAPTELEPMALEMVDTAASRATDSDQEPPLTHRQTPFYQQPPAIYHWRSGWSMILPRHSCCPQLASDGGCRIYSRRPRVCRRPQIFAYILETEPPTAAVAARDRPAVYRARHKVLAIWDCPYVKALQDDIAGFAEACGLEPIFRRNKS